MNHESLTQNKPDAERGMNDKATPSIPSISLPKGGGAIHGMGEKFAANPVNGTGSMTVPITTSPGRSGFGPKLVLSYDSASGNGPFGFGWDLSLPSITRKTDKGVPQYDDEAESDVYVLSGAEDLVPVLVERNGQWERDSKVRMVDGIDYRVQRYRPRIEGLFERIERWTNLATGVIHWRSITHDNVTTTYGKDNNSRIFDPESNTPDGPTRIFNWLICQTYDDKGNASVYEYAAEDSAGIDLGQTYESNRTNESRSTNRYLKRIKYGNRTSRLLQPDLEQMEWLFEVVFDYDEGHYDEVPLDPSRPVTEQHQFVRATAARAQAWRVRPDPFSSYRSCFEVRTYRRCRRVLTFHRFDELGPNPYLVRATEFDYADFDFQNDSPPQAELAHHGSSRFASFIRSVSQSGYVRADDRELFERNGIKYVTYLKKTLPPLDFEYSKARISDEIIEVDDESLTNLPYGVDNTGYQWVDLDGEGVSGILTEQGRSWFYKPNLGDGKLGPLERVAALPSLTNLNSGSQQLLDLAGDGQLDLVSFMAPTPGFFERTDDQSWNNFKSFAHLPNLAWQDSNLRFVDLTGDGHADVLITDNDVFTWYPSLGEDGFGAAERVFQSMDHEEPRLVFADPAQSIYLADMSGDGLVDLLRVRNGEVCYWPSLGRGRFGPKVTMDNAPWFDNPDQFEQRRIRLADIDGSGTNDIIYLGPDSVNIYFNQAGNSWSNAHRLHQFPQVDNVSAVSTVDLLGNGTACLVWSSPLRGNSQRPMRYIDLMSGQKPHLLIKAVNNLGSETEVNYVSSTKFYLEDKRNGRPWVTRLPFPVHVVESVIINDRVSGSVSVNRYAYHHGYFDGMEREFRGFGMVEQWDTEEFAALAASDKLRLATNIEAASHLAPVLTKTWFHTGVFIGRDHVADFFAGLFDDDTGEYYGEPGLSDAQARALLLEDTVLPPGLSAEEEREACRALKGTMLRQEIFGLDGTSKEQHPYTVTERNFGVRLLQPRGDNRNAVFLPHACESIVYQYEREPSDPRISHSLTLEVDQFGNIIKSAAINYGRRKPDPSLSAEDQIKQAATFIIYTHDGVTNAVETAGDYRTPLPSESRKYELTGLSPAASNNRFTFAEILDAGDRASSLDYEAQPTPGRLEKRLIEHTRTYYRSDNLSGPLPLGKQESLALPFESYKLAFTPGMITGPFGGRVNDTILENEGRYVHVEEDKNWWIPSGRSFYSPDPQADPTAEFDHARRHFFLPHRYRDAFHSAAVSTENFASYDAYDLLLQETRDALDNYVTVGERSIDPSQPLVGGGHDYRVLQPGLVMDFNRNRSEVAFDALGMVVGTAMMGKPEESPVPGDRLSSTFQTDLTDSQIDEFLDNPTGPIASTLLDEATTRIVYDLTRYLRKSDSSQKSPVVASVLARETHVSEQAAKESVKIQVDFSYSDGFGREIQKKIQAEPGPVPPRDDLILNVNRPPLKPIIATHRWVGSGWTIFNNKGKPVRKYEPFFTDTHHFEFDRRVGVSSVLFYDPALREMAALHPNHTWEKTVFGPWHQENWDVNDTSLVTDPATDADAGDFFARMAREEYLPTWHALRTDPANADAFAALYPNVIEREHETAAARKTELHAGTPAVTLEDALGRSFVTITHNKFKYSNRPAAEPPVEEFHRTATNFDIKGNEREMIDANGRVVMRYDYDVLGNRVHQSSMEAGERWMLNDVAGKTLYAWDSRGHMFRTAYDQLRRPVASFMSNTDGAEALVEENIYGETRRSPEGANLRGKVAELRDQSGSIVSDQYDFKGNLLLSHRRLAESYNSTLDWSGPVRQQPETYSSRSRYDALNRLTQLIAPHSDLRGTTINVIQPAYNEANLLQQIDAWLNQSEVPATQLDPVTANLHAVTNIDYDARGRRALIDYGNGSSTTYRYDPFTFQLTHLLTSRNSATFPGDCPASPPTGWPGCQVQNLHYTYDPNNNVTHIRDEAQQAIYFRNKRVEPDSDFTYDSTYRLIEATGREHLGQIGGEPIVHSYNDGFRTGLVHPNDGNAMARYLERYLYDFVGNLQEMQHQGSDLATPGWKRTYNYSEQSQLENEKPSNRLTSTTVGKNTEIYSVDGDGYSPHGHMLRLPHLSIMESDFKDQLQMIQRQKVNDDDKDGQEHDGERTWYVYDSSGQRVRKVIEGPGGGIREERIYFGGFEIYRRHGATSITRERLQITDDKQLVFLVEMRTEGDEPGVPRQRIRYQLTNHLGSISLELDDQAQIISYEEYTPYGSSSYQAVSNQLETPKRYRFTGKERDAESGLYYHGARYYAPWLARWTSSDPAGLVDGMNLYVYVNDNPLMLVDMSGMVRAIPEIRLITEPWKSFALPSRNWIHEVIATRKPKNSRALALRHRLLRVQTHQPAQLILK